jgi:hypothetical protein
MEDGVEERVGVGGLILVFPYVAPPRLALVPSSAPLTNLGLSLPSTPPADSRRRDTRPRRPAGGSVGEEVGMITAEHSATPRPGPGPFPASLKAGPASPSPAAFPVSLPFQLLCCSSPEAPATTAPTPGQGSLLCAGECWGAEKAARTAALSSLRPPPGRPAAAGLAAARGPRGLTCSAFPGPDASPPCAGQRGAGSQTRVTTAPRAASLCSSGSREGRASPPSCPPHPSPAPTAASAAGGPPPPAASRST